jgi:hexosaminidase
MSWRGEAGAITAAQQGHDVVMTTGETYLDAYQSNPSTQPLAIGGFLPIQRVYAYEPIPAVLKENEKKHILGTQGNLWTEFMPSTDHVEYMAFPRAIAIAENGWTQKEAKNYPDFQQRLQAHYLLLQRMNVNYYRPSAFLEVKEAPAPDNSGNAITLISEIYQPEIRYTTDGSTPSSSSERYIKPFVVQGKANIQAAVFKNGVPLGKVTTYQANHHRAIGKKTIFNTRWSDAYPAQQENTLTNGVRGSFTYSDKQWLGYLKNFDVTVDMGSAQPIREVAITFMQQTGPGVFLPAYVEILGSEDGSKFVPLKKLEHDVSPENPELLFKTFACELEQIKVRYIRVVAPNVRGGFMFTDEIVVY